MVIFCIVIVGDLFPNSFRVELIQYEKYTGTYKAGPSHRRPHVRQSGLQLTFGHYKSCLYFSKKPVVWNLTTILSVHDTWNYGYFRPLFIQCRCLKTCPTWVLFGALDFIPVVSSDSSWFEQSRSCNSPWRLWSTVSLTTLEARWRGSICRYGKASAVRGLRMSQIFCTVDDNWLTFCETCMSVGTLSFLHFNSNFLVPWRTESSNIAVILLWWLQRVQNNISVTWTYSVTRQF
jgi:hypothetical protein